MGYSIERIEETSKNPLDLAEYAVAVRNWEFDRITDSELVAKAERHWDNYSILFSWQSQLEAVLFSTTMGTKVPKNLYSKVYQLIGRYNEKLWLGHFDLCADNGYIIFRHSQTFRGCADVSAYQFEDLIDVAINECERFYPAIQSVMWGGKSPEEAVNLALFETKGEA